MYYEADWEPVQDQKLPPQELLKLIDQAQEKMCTKWPLRKDLLETAYDLSILFGGLYMCV